jgi:hypothetical protein
MGYCVHLTEAKFRIAADKALGNGSEHPDASGGYLCRHEEVRWFAWMNNANADAWTCFADAMRDWRYPVELDADGNVANISFVGEKLGDEKAMLAAIAPYVDASSYIQMHGEDGEMWRWVFDGTRFMEVQRYLAFDS